LHRKIHNAVGGALLLGAEDTSPIAWLTFRYASSSEIEKTNTSGSPNSTTPAHHPGSAMMNLLMTIVQKKPSQLALPSGFGGMLHIKVEP